MGKFEIVINRTTICSESIIGELSVNGTKLCYTLEKMWWWNKEKVSCVPNGRYDAFLRYDKPDRWRIQLSGVPGRAGIQIHIGNYPHQIEGCVLVGTTYSNNMVLNSAEAYAKLKAAFYGTTSPNHSPAKTITVEIKGVQATPWGDYPEVERIRGPVRTV